MNELRPTVMPIVIQTEFNLYEIEPPLVQPCQFANTGKGWHSEYDVLCTKCGGCIDWPLRVKPIECKG